MSRQACDDVNSSSLIRSLLCYFCLPQGWDQGTNWPIRRVGARTPPMVNDWRKCVLSQAESKLNSKRISAWTWRRWGSICGPGQDLPSTGEWRISACWVGSSVPRLPLIQATLGPSSVARRGWSSLQGVTKNVSGFPHSSVGKEPACKAGDPGSIFGSGRRKWQPTPVFLPGKSHGQRILAGYGPWGHKSQTWLSNLTTKYLYREPE